MAELVFIHGAGASAGVWERQVEHLSQAHEVLAVALPGHGSGASAQAFADHERHAEEVVRLARERGFAWPVLVGHALGGAVALTIALVEPTFPRGLVLAACERIEVVDRTETIRQ